MFEETYWISMLLMSIWPVAIHQLLCINFKIYYFIEILNH